MLWGKRYSRIVAFSIGEGGPRQRRSGTFVNCLLETISPALFHPAFPIQPPPLRGTSFHRKEGVSTQAPSLGRGCRAQRGGGGFLFGGEAASSLPSPLRKSLLGKRYSRFFIHPTQKRPSLTSGRFYVYYLLRETLIKSQNSISHVFSCNASS